MEQLIHNLTALLGQKFPGAKLELGSAPGANIGGAFIWDGFEGKEQIDRQIELWNVLRQQLSREEQLRISVLFNPNAR